jgi:hypothetical protein
MRWITRASNTVEAIVYDSKDDFSAVVELTVVESWQVRVRVGEGASRSEYGRKVDGEVLAGWVNRKTRISCCCRANRLFIVQLAPASIILRTNFNAKYLEFRALYIS